MSEPNMHGLSDDWNKLKHLVDLSAENARLKAEVERLESMADENAHLHKGIYSLSLNVVQLKDEVERLRKAGDAMERSLSFAYPDSPKIKDWNAAKEGKPQS